MVKCVNEGNQVQYLDKAMSMNLDLPESNYDMLRFSDAWSREWHVKARTLEQGMQTFGSMRGIIRSR